MDREVLVTFFKDNGKSFKVGNRQPWRFLKSNGLSGFSEFTGAVSQVENYSTDGGRIENVRLSLKDRTISIGYTDLKNNDIARKTLETFFTYNESYNIYISYMGTVRWARGRLYKMQLSDEIDVTNLQWAKMTFRFENPYWLSPDDFGKDIANIIPMIAFPYICPKDIGMTGGAFEFNQEVEIINDADANTFPVITIRAKGNVTNPAIIINEAQVKIIDNLVHGDKIVFDFNALPPTIKKNGSNALGLCDRASNFDAMFFSVGTNTISFDADDGDINMSVSVRFYKKYALI